MCLIESGKEKRRVPRCVDRMGSSTTYCKIFVLSILSVLLMQALVMTSSYAWEAPHSPAAGTDGDQFPGENLLVVPRREAVSAPRINPSE